MRVQGDSGQRRRHINGIVDGVGYIWRQEYETDGEVVIARVMGGN